MTTPARQTREALSEATGGWRPLLEGAARESALRAVRDIAAVTRDATIAWADERPDRAGVNAVSLACGRAGTAIFYAYCAAADVVPGADEVAIELLEQAIEGMGEKAVGSSLYCGFAGVAWATEHIGRMSGGELPAPEDDPNADIDAALLDHLREQLPDPEYDLIDGLVGLGVYALERLPHESGAECLRLVIDRLAQIARIETDGLAWPTPLRRYATHDLAPGSQGDYNLGLAHGVPGVIALLGRAIAANVEAARCAEMLDGAIRWLLARQLPQDSISLFPGYTGGEIEVTPARCAWCYGDPGVSAALMNAASCARRADWAEAAARVARHAAAVRERRVDVRDAGLCHGAAGVGHIFNRMFQATSDTVLRDAASYWFERAFAMRGDAGLAGFQTWSLERTMDGEWIDDPRFLTGVCGTGLALLAAATDVEPAWDRIMLVDVPLVARRESSGS